MKRLLFISLFLLINGIVNAQNQRISVDLLSPGLSRINNNSPSDRLKLLWFSMTYESQRKESKTWGLRASFLQSIGNYENSIREDINTFRQIKLIPFKKKYVDNKYFGLSFIGHYGSISYLEDKQNTIFLSGETDTNSKSSLHLGGGFLLGANFYIVEHLLLEFVGGLGLGLAFNSAFYDTGLLSGLNNGFISFSPSFLDVNLCYEF